MTPAPARSRLGNRVTALRWAGLLRSLGHGVRVLEAWGGERCDVLVVLHATKSHASAVRWRAERGPAPLVAGCGGTDLYVDLPAGAAEPRATLELADRVVVLQPLGVEALPGPVRARTRVIQQSARRPAGVAAWRPGDEPRALVLAHLRPVKDPFLAADAVRLLPSASRVAVDHAGAALTPEGARRAEDEARASSRWRWLGAIAHAEALRRLARSWVLLVTSHSEGGSNAVAEAVACGVPVLSTRNAGSVGQLGPEHPGLFDVGDAGGLARLLLACEREAAFRTALLEAGARVAPRFSPAREREAWAALLRELA